MAVDGITVLFIVTKNVYLSELSPESRSCMGIFEKLSAKGLSVEEILYWLGEDDFESVCVMTQLNVAMAPDCDWAYVV